MNRTLNITIEPFAKATAVGDPKIEEIRSKKTGAIYGAQKFIERQRYDRIVKNRNLIRELMIDDTPRFLCGICSVPVYLVSSPLKRFFFRHQIEDGRCPAVTKDSRSEPEIRALKYLGARESDAHKRIKSLIARSLDADRHFEDIEIEKTWRSIKDRSRYRRPDVCARFGGVRLAFEAQLSTTFLDVVVRRRKFYRDEGALLVWVLRNFDPEYRRLMFDDILFMNNSNIIVIDDETTILSESERKFHVRCVHRKPVVVNFNVEDTWESHIVPFDAFTLQPELQKAFLFDFEKAEREVRARIDEKLAELKKIAAEKKRQEDQNLREYFFENWDFLRESDYESNDFPNNSLGIKAEFMRRGIRLPEYIASNFSFHSAVSAILSAKNGRPIGYGFQKLIQVAHHLADNYPENLLYFGYALEKYGHKVTIEIEDKSGKWENRARKIRHALKHHESHYQPRGEWVDTILFLFPEISDSVRNFMSHDMKNI